MLQMKHKTRSVGVSSEKSPADVDILAVKRAIEEFRAHIKAIQPQMAYIARITDPKVAFGAQSGTNRVQCVMFRYAELMRINRPRITVHEAALLVLAMNRGNGPFLHPVHDLATYFCVALEGLSLRMTGLPCGNCTQMVLLLTKLRKMTSLELCSLVDSVDQVVASGKSEMTWAELNSYFNLSGEAEEVNHG